jgi:hypothetical protein
MTYVTGASSGSKDMLSIISTFLQGEGWTLELDAADPLPLDSGGSPPTTSINGAGQRTHLSKSGVIVNFHAIDTQASGTGLTGELVWDQEANGAGQPNDSGIGMYLSSSFSGSTPWNKQSGGPVGSGSPHNHVGTGAAWKKAAIVSYHLFHDGNDNYMLVFEVPDGVFSYLGFGLSLEKAGSYPGGQYFFGSVRSGYHQNYFPGSAFPFTPEPGHGATAISPFHSVTDFSAYDVSGFVYAQIDTYTGWLAAQGSNTVGSDAAGWTGRACCPATFYNVYEGSRPLEIPNYWFFQDRQTSAMNGLMNLLPIRIFGARDTSGWSLLGQPGSVYYCNGTQHGTPPKSVYSLGSDDYMIFPEFAVKKVP